METTIFTFSSDLNNLKVLVQLPENICYKGNSGFLLNKIIRPSGMAADNLAFQAIPIPGKGKLKKAQVIDLIDEASTFCDTYGIDIILCGAADVFKVWNKEEKFTLNIGRAVQNLEVARGSGKKKELVVEANKYNIVPLLNPIILNSYPHKVSEVQKGLSVAKALVDGTYTEAGEVIKDIEVNEIIQDPEIALKVAKKLFKKDRLFVDIETTGLRWQKDKLLTISFAVSEKEAYCFVLHEQYYKGDREKCKSVRNIVTQFFKKYEGEFIGHNWVGFDQAFITHELLRNGDFKVPHEPIINSIKLGDTMIMAYLLMNSTERPSIGLKQLAYKWMGSYDKDIDQRRLESAPLEKVATYNNYDVIATALVYNELWDRVKKEGFEDTYNLFIGIGKQLLKVKMNGLRVDVDKAKKLSIELESSIADDRDNMLDSPLVKLAEKEWAYRRLSKMSSKSKTVEDLIEPFNPGSPSQKKILFFDIMHLPEIKKSKTTKEPSTDSETLNAWLEDPSIDDEKKQTIKDIMEYQLASKIQSTYISTIIESAVEVAEGDFRIFANFNQTATISGRLSSSGDINFQTIPSSSKYAKKVKELFIAPEGFLLATADYSALFGGLQ